MSVKRLALSVLGFAALICVCVLAYAAWFSASVEAEHPPLGELVEVNGSDVHLVERGQDGPPILLVHGAGANAREFGLSLTPLLAKDHRVFAADRPAHGYSEDVDNAHRLGVQAEQMAGLLDGRSNGEKAVIVGHSFGTAVAIRIALDHPEHVKGVVLIAPVAYAANRSEPAWYYRYGALPWLGPAFSQLMPIFGPTQARAGMANSFAPAPEPDGFYDEAGVDLLFRPSHFTANARDIVALDDELNKQSARYKDLDVPVLVIYGAGDTSADPLAQVEALRRDVRGLEVLAFEDEGHVPHMRKAELVAAAIAEMARGTENKR